MNEEIINNETLEDSTSETLENQEILTENVSDTEHTDLSVESDLSLNENDVTADLNEEQSSSDSSAVTDENGESRTFTQDEVEQIISALFVEEQAVELSVEQQTEQAVIRSLFNTPLVEYSVSDGLLVCILFVLLAQFIHSIFKGSHWFGKL